MSSTELLPQSHSVLLKSFSISNVAVDDIPEQAPLKPDDAMENKLPLDADTHKAIVELLGSVPALSRGIAASHNIAPLDNFLRSDSPIPEYPGRYSPPIFSRDRRPGHRTSFTSILTSTETKRPSGLNTMSDLPSFVPKVTVKEEEEDLDDQHLVIVNGWQAYEIPSSPLSAGTPSLGDCSSQVDELFLPSPPDSEPVLQSLMLAKMDEHEFARSEKIGGACTKRKLLSESASFGAFMSTMLPRPQARDNRVRIATSPKSHPSSPHTPITASMLGQPPSAIFGPNDVDHDRTQRACLDFDDDRLYSDDGKDLNAIVEQVCGERLGEDPTDIIMKEKLDEKDGMLMDVPHLHPPNVHPPNALFLPTCMLELLITQGPDATRVGNGDVIKVADTGFLRKIKGFMPLQIELTWRPFKFGPTKPTDEEVTNIADNPRDELANDIELNGEKVLLEVSRLLDETTALCIHSTDHSDNSPSARSWQADSSGMDLRGMVEFDSETHEMILTAEERRRLHGLPDVVQLQDEEMNSGCSDKENDP
ncbi:hypothetical protein A0H81_01498 [Grifola frondosa]|uniref:Uncharacterized protein n=1 Tax=Grifola frondosa TaxID=5627 RepID=A0A1C7MSC7_GRIFR|nr:hypothetical protein A0H81_01498 [Grifola frondosa]